MKKGILLVGVLGLFFILLILKYGFMIVFWLTTPKDGDLYKEEILLFEKIKIKHRAERVLREPKYNLSASHPQSFYRIIISRIPCNSINDSVMLKSDADSIYNETSKFIIAEKFPQKEVMFICKSGEEIRFFYPKK